MSEETAIPHSASRRPWQLPRFWPLLPAVLFLGAAFVCPVALLLSTSFVDSSGALSAASYTRLLDSAVVAQVLLITLNIAGWTALLSILGGYPIAYLLATASESRRNRLMILVLMPFWTSFLVRAFAWIVLLGRNGPVSQLLMLLGVDYPPSFLYNFTGVMVGMVHAMMPLCVLTMLAVMENIDPNLTRAAGTLGARPTVAFWRVYFPRSLPGVAAGGLLVFITALGFFITPALLGGAQETTIVMLVIFQIQELLDWDFAGAIAIMLLTAALIIFFFYDRLVGLSTLSGGNARLDASARRNPIGWVGRRIGALFISVVSELADRAAILWERIFPVRADRPHGHGGRRLCWIMALLLIAFLALPALFIIPVSFTEASFLGWPPVGFSLQWYESVLSDPLWIEAAIRSFSVALSAATLGLLLGVPAAFYLVHQARFGKTAILAFLVSPIIIPNVIIAVSLFYLYARIGLVGTNLGLVIGHTVLAVPYVVVTTVAVLKNYDQGLDHAAYTLGANKLRTFRHVTLPLIRSGLIAAFMFAFVISFDELTIALFVSSGDVITLPKKMWDSALLRVSPALAVVAVLILVFMTGVILVSEYLRRRGTGEQ